MSTAGHHPQGSWDLPVNSQFPVCVFLSFVSVFSSVCPSPVSFLLCQSLSLCASVFPVPCPGPFL